MQLLTDSGRAAGVLLPGGALGGEDMRLIASRPPTLPPPASSHLSLLALLSQAGCPKNAHYLKKKKECSLFGPFCPWPPETPVLGETQLQD